MNFSAVILAGGQSTRMGRDKAFLKLGGQTLLGRQIDAFAAAGADDILISGRRDADYSAFGHRVLYDQFSNAGPLAGIHTAMKNSNRPLMFVLAVDMPEMNAMFLRSLLLASAGEKGVVPRVGERVEPLAAIYPRAAMPIIEQMISQQNFAVRQFADACVRYGLATQSNVPAGLGRRFTNLNSSADLMLA